MRSLALASICFVLFGATYAAEKPIPQDPERQQQMAREDLAWFQRTLAGAYDKVGKQDPRWDKPAREAMEAAARMYAKQSNPPSSLDDIYVAARKAVVAGCDDPLILYLYARGSLESNFPGSDEFIRRIETAATAMETSKYPPVWRATALLMTGLNFASIQDPPEKVRKQALGYLDAAMAQAAHWEANREPNRAKEFTWFQLCMESIQGYKAVLGDYKVAFDRVDAVLAKYPGLKNKRLIVKGDFLIEWAWEGRGSGYANTVTPEGWKLLRERMTEARKVLEEVWAEEPGNAIVATKMINVELALGGGNRAQMEEWFERAMKANPDNHQACMLKLEWLDPKWHGTPEEMLAFGRACRDTKNWSARIPLILPETRRRLMRTIPTDKRSGYFKTEEIWKEVDDVYTEYLKRYPHDHGERSKFAGYCYVCGKFPESDRQFQILGNNVEYSEHFKEKWMKQVRAYVAGKGKP